MIIVVVVVAVKAVVGEAVAAAVGTVVVAAVDTVVAAVDTVVVAAVVLNECAEQDSNGRCPSQGLKYKIIIKCSTLILAVILLMV